jgi:hypothetical protein
MTVFAAKIGIDGACVDFSYFAYALHMQVLVSLLQVLLCFVYVGRECIEKVQQAVIGCSLTSLYLWPRGLSIAALPEIMVAAHLVSQLTVRSLTRHLLCAATGSERSTMSKRRSM